MPGALGRSGPPTDEDRRILRRYRRAVEFIDLTAVAEPRARDVQATMPP